MKGDKMKKNKLLFFTKTIVALFLIGTMILFFIIYKDIKSDIAFKFMIGYLILLLSMVIYIPSITIINSRKLKGTERRRRLLQFVVVFVLVGISKYSLYYVFIPSEIEIHRVFSTALGWAFGLAFFDVLFFKKEEKKIGFYDENGQKIIGNSLDLLLLKKRK